MPVDVCLNKQICDSEKLRMHYPWESDFTPGRTLVSRLHDIGTSFRTGMKIAVRYSNRSDSHRYDSLHYEILCWYHVNEY